MWSGSDGDTSGRETPRRTARLHHSVREYVAGLPALFEDGACLPLFTAHRSRSRSPRDGPRDEAEADGDDDDDARVRLACDRCDRAGLVGLVLSAERRWRLALDELLDQEQRLGDALAARHALEAVASEQDGEVETLRMQLQAADEYSEALLREKAEALRKLTEAKSELAVVSARAASLQREDSVREVREKELGNSLTSTSLTTTAESVRRNETPYTAAQCRKFVDHIAQLRREIAMHLSDVLNGDHSNTTTLLRVHKMLRFSCSSSLPDDDDDDNDDNRQLQHCAQQRQRRMGRTSLELEQSMREKTVECARTPKQPRLETKFLKNAERLAQKLRASDTLESQPFAGSSRKREELLGELQQCRQYLRELAMCRDDFLPPPHEIREAARTQWGLMAQLAAALEESLAANEGLRTELDCVRCEKKMQEISYEVELFRRVMEMEDLTNALHELREQVGRLNRQCYQKNLSVTRSSLTRESKCPPTAISKTAVRITNDGKAVSEFLGSQLSATGQCNHSGSCNGKTQSFMSYSSVQVFNGMP